MCRRIVSFSLLCSLVLLSSFSAMAQDSEKKVSMKNLPPAVQKTVREQSQGAKIRGLAKEVEKGKTSYEAELLVNGHAKDVLIDPDGKVLAIEEEVTLSSVPAAVKAEIEKQMGKGRISKLETVTKNGTLEYYEAIIKTGAKRREIKVNLEGKLIK